MDRAIVTIETPNGEQYDFRVGQTDFTVGRSARCDLSLPSPAVSSRHARFEVDTEAGSARVTDTGSKNGTFVGDRRIPPDVPVTVDRDTQVRIANVVLRLRPVGPDDASQSLSLDSSDSLSRSLLQGMLGEALKQNRATIQVLKGPAAGARLTIDESARRASLGSGTEVDLDLMEPGLARHPLAVELEGTAYTLQRPPEVDVRVGRQRVRDTRELRSGDTIRVFRTTLLFTDPLQRAIDELSRLERSGGADATQPRVAALGSTAHSTPGWEWAEWCVLVLAIMAMITALAFLLVILNVVRV